MGAPAKNKLRKAIGKQLRYLKGNLGHIKAMIENNEALLTNLTDYEYKCLLVIDTLYEQQLRMSSERIQRIEDRIFSIIQPHVRPIVRGKALQALERMFEKLAWYFDGRNYCNYDQWKSANVHLIMFA